MSSKLLTEHEAAELIGYSVHWLRRKRWESSGPKYLKIGTRAVRYREADLFDWIDANTKEVA
jgi:predicted DNA-binding transcriptional regulator AlpA